MDREAKSDFQFRNQAAASLPPAMIGETGWDIILALSAEERSLLSLDKLAAMASVPRLALGQWLEWLEERQLIASGRHRLTNEIGAAITRAGRELVENYLLATRSLQRNARS